MTDLASIGSQTKTKRFSLANEVQINPTENQNLAKLQDENLDLNGRLSSLQIQLNTALEQNQDLEARVSELEQELELVRLKYYDQSKKLQNI